MDSDLLRQTTVQQAKLLKRWRCQFFKHSSKGHLAECIIYHAELVSFSHLRLNYMIRCSNTSIRQFYFRNWDDHLGFLAHRLLHESNIPLRWSFSHLSSSHYVSPRVAGPRIDKQCTQLPSVRSGSWKVFYSWEQAKEEDNVAVEAWRRQYSSFCFVRAHWHSVFVC